MINLLPPDIKQSITFARRNRRLQHWAITLWLSVVGVFVIVGFGMLYLNQSIKANNVQLAETQAQLKAEKLDETQKQVEGISSDLKLVVQVLGKEVLFSKLIQQIGAAMPRDTVLTGLSIDKIQGGIDLTARATTYESATQIQVNMSDPNNKIFSKADINGISCKPGSTIPLEAKYPCLITVRAQFGNNNPFLFLNSTGAKQ